MAVEPAAALDFTVRMVACGSAISALEMLAGRHQFARRGVFSLGAVAPFKRRTRLLAEIDRFILPLLGVQAAAAAVLAALGPLSAAGRAALVATLVAFTAVRWRRHLAGDGAEQLTTLVLASAALAVLPAPSAGRVALAVAFIAAQLLLSYLTAGLAKLVSPVWRNGSALPAIVSTQGHGHPWAAGLLRHSSVLPLAAAWVVISFECLFPLAAVAPEPIAAAAFAVGLVFHLGCAFFMGLGSFFWAFPATYPCVISAMMLLGELATGRAP